MNSESNAHTRLHFDRLMTMEIFLDFDPVFPDWPPIDATEKMGQQQNEDQQQASGTPRIAHNEAIRDHATGSRAAFQNAVVIRQWFPLR